MRGRGGARGGVGRGGGGGGGGGRAPSAPWSRLRPVELDPLEAMGLPSKGDNRLLDFKTQERYHTKIVERYMSFCSDAGERDELLRRFASVDIAAASDRENSGTSGGSSSHRPTSSSSTSPPSSNVPTTAAATSAPSTLRLPPTTPKSAVAPPRDTKGLSDVLSALRKLREGIVASKRVDDFAIQAYLFCIRVSVLVRHHESYHPAILHLLRHMQPRHHGMTTVELAEVAAYLVLDAACRRRDLAEAYALRRRYRLRDAKVDAVLDALAHDNYVKLARLRRRVDGHRARIIEFADEDMRLLALKCFGRTYLSVDLAFLEACADRKWDGLVAEDGVGWELDGGKVVIRKAKAK